MAKPIFPDDPQSSAALPHNFVNPQGEAIGPADYFINYSGLTGENLKAALASAGLEPITDADGNVIGAASKQIVKSVKSAKLKGGATIVMEPILSGERIDSACRRAAAMASSSGIPHRFVFNGAPITVDPGESWETVLARWDQMRDKPLTSVAFQMPYDYPGFTIHSTAPQVTKSTDIGNSDPLKALESKPKVYYHRYGVYGPYEPSQSLPVGISGAVSSWGATVNDDWDELIASKAQRNTDAPRKDPEILIFDHKRKIELEKE